MKYFNVFSFIVFLLCIASCSNENWDNSDSEVINENISLQEKFNFYKVKSYQIGNLQKNESAASFTLEEGLIIEEVSEQKYFEMKRTSSRYYLKDTLSMMKKNQNLVIGNTKLTDKIYSKNRFESYLYLGYFPILNQYLIKGTYSESEDYKLIDKNSGQIKQSLISYPIISFKANFIAVCSFDHFEKVTNFEIYKFHNGMYFNAFKAKFINWEVLDFQENSFWGTDGSIYLKVFLNNNEKNIAYIKATLN